jgi:hypothetical protein
MANLLINPFGLGSATPKMGHSLGGPQATIAQTAYGAQQSPVGNPGQLQSWHLAVAVPALVSPQIKKGVTMKRHPFATGFVTGLLAVWGYHHFVKPLPGGGATGALSGKG